MDARPSNPLTERYVGHEGRVRRRARKTLRQKRLVIGDLTRFLGQRHGLELDDPDLLLFADLEDLLAWQESLQRMSTLSAATYVAVVRAFYRWVASEESGELLDRNPAARLKPPRVPRGVPHPIADEDLFHALDLAAASDERMHCWLLLAAGCGLRCCEIANLRAEHVRIDDRSQTVRVLVKNSKGGKDRVLTGGAGLAAALRPFKRDAKYGPLFTSLERATGQLRQITPELVSNYINRFLRQVVGISDTAHSLRHWFGTATYAATRDIRATQEALGHSSPTITAVYAAIVDGHDGALGRDMDAILASRGRIDARRAHLQPVASAIERARPEQYVLAMRAEGRRWRDIANAFAISIKDAKRLARTAFGLDQQQAS